MFDVLIHLMVRQLMIHQIHLLVSQFCWREFDINATFFFYLVNLDRGRGELDNDIRKLLSDIRDRRSRLVHENSQSIPFIPTSIDTPAAMS